MPESHPQTARPRKKGGFSARFFSRSLAMKGLYQHFLTDSAAEVIALYLEEGSDFPRSDKKYFREIFYGACSQPHQADLLSAISVHLDRPLHLVSPVERAILLVAVYELSYRPEVPCWVIMNEAIELAKRFGSVDGYCFINGVLDPLITQYRAAECKPTAAALVANS